MALPIRPGRRTTTLVAAGIAGLTLSACGSGGGTADGSASTDVVSQAQRFVKDSTAEVAWPVPTTPIASPVDLSGKKVAIIPLSDKIPLMHGVAAGMVEALHALGAQGYICDGGANPSVMADCLKTAGDQHVAAAVTLYMDYAPLANAIDALTARATKDRAKEEVA